VGRIIMHKLPSTFSKSGAEITVQYSGAQFPMIDTRRLAEYASVVSEYSGMFSGSVVVTMYCHKHFHIADKCVKDSMFVSIYPFNRSKCLHMFFIFLS